MKKPYVKYNSLEDSELIALIGNDKAAFRVLYDRHWKNLYRFAYNILQDEMVCEDLVQEVFVDLWKKADSKHIQQVSAFLFQSTKFQVLKHIRNGKIREAHLERLKEISLEEDQSDTLEVREMETQVRSIISQLPERCRQIFEMSRFEQLSNQEIAQKLQISVQTVKNQITKALQHLKDQLPAAS